MGGGTSLSGATPSSSTFTLKARDFEQKDEIRDGSFAA